MNRKQAECRTFVAHDEEEDSARVVNFEEHPSGSVWLKIETTTDGAQSVFLMHPRDVIRLETWLAERAPRS